jgi:molybdenum cofactor biosynthesis protein B
MGYAEHQQAAAHELARCAVITLSDTRSAETDKSGRRICELLAGGGHSTVFYRVIRDEPKTLDALLEQLLDRDDVDAIITNGGTGISRRDHTIEVVQKRLDQPLPGFGELFRMLSWEQIGSGAMLSRAVGGVARNKMIFALPGSTAAVELAVTKLILPEITHLIHELHK